MGSSSSSSSFLLLVLIIACALTFGGLTPASAQSCPFSLTSTNGTLRSFSNCTDLQNQGCTLSWTFQPSDANNLGGTLDVAFRTKLTSSSGWAGWGMNLELPVDGKMVGTSALIAFNARNGSNVLPYKLTSEVKNFSPLVCSPIDMVVLDSGVVIVDSEVTIFATIRLPPNRTVIRQVWNLGPDVTDFEPQAHDLSDKQTTSSYATLDVSSGAVTGGTVLNQDLKNKHGIVNVVAWGIFFPIGIMATRYIRPFTESAWFYIHVPIQFIGYAIGVAGFGTGLKLQQDSGNIRYKHRNIGIALFTLATLQVTALVLRPKREHKLRQYWNVYHHGVGYGILILSIINIFEGFDILLPANKYKHAYIGVLSTLAAIAVVMEIITWAIWLRKTSRSRPERLDPKATNGQAADFKDPPYDGAP